MTDQLSPWARKMRIKEAASKQQSRQFIESRDAVEKQRRQERARRLKETLAQIDDYLRTHAPTPICSSNRVTITIHDSRLNGTASI